jgi:ribonuclease Z
VLSSAAVAAAGGDGRVQHSAEKSKMALLELVLLGTSSPIHSGHRFGPAQAIIGGDVTLLIDCGWGATLRLYQAGIRLPRVSAVFFTHLHSDHTTDFADFLVMRWVGGIDTPLPVYGPEGTANMVEGFRQALSADTRFRLAHHGEKLSPLGTQCDVREVTAGETPVEIARIGDVTVSAFAVDHRPVIPAFGYRVDRGGRVITVSGDTNPCPGLINGARGADLLVCDSMNRAMMNAFQENLRRAGNELQAALLADAHSYHASTEDAATVAKSAGVKHLVLSHVMPAIPEEGPQVEQFVAGLEAIFDGEITVGRDLQRFALD